ncbi:MAG: cyclopropane-fatty-acyl-phospholipid synthase family protein [Nocardioides sp.]|nr:cyclopropane-fatty-acyl-phospholipid synthase family protein [Nocardioides sp.]
MTVAPTRRSANHWPDLDVVPSGPRAALSGRVARRLFSAAVNRLDVTVELAATSTRPATTLGCGGPVMVVNRPDDFFARIGRHALIGFGESYLTREWDAEDVGGFLTVLAAEVQHLVPRPLQKLRSLVVKRPPHEEKSSLKNSQDNIAHHYDLSNDLFELFLDPTVSYSSALFEAELPHPIRAQLEPAQGRKIERLLDQAGVTQGTRVLEIGSGWGELAIRAAQRGAHVTTITLSTEQKALAEERIAAAGCTALVSVELCDYRNVRGSYDAVVSVEMVEAVGWQYWDTYFQTIDRVLAPGGRVAIQAITMPHDRMLATRNTYTWINKYIFPGGFLPSVQAIDEITRAHTSLRVCDNLPMGASYAETLRLWDETFLADPERVLSLGFDETFLRMWHFYLEYSRAGFASGYIDVNQLTFERPTDPR